MGIGIRKSEGKTGRITKSWKETKYVDTGERYPNGRKKYKQVVRSLGPFTNTQSPPIHKPIRLDDALFDLIRERKLQEREWKRYQKISKNLTAYFPDKYLDEITEESCRKYRDSRLEKGLQNSTVDHELALLRHIIYTAMRNKRCSLLENPVNKWVTIRKSNKRDRYLTIEEEAILFSAMHWRARLLSEAILLTGMRPGEAIHLHKSRVDLRTNHIRLHKTKTTRARELKIGPLLREIIIKSLENNRYDNVFLNCFNRPYKSTENYDVYFHKICGRLGIKNLKPHDLRHTYATRLVRSNVHISRVQYYLGHASVKTTERYIHIDTYCEDDILVTENYTNEARILSNHNNRHNNDP